MKLTEALPELFRRAAEAARFAGQVEEDGGTCNLDSPAFRIDRMSEDKIKAAAEAAGCSATSFHWFGGRRWFWLHCGLLGQGNRRARMAQAAYRVLRDFQDSGEFPAFHSHLYCQMD